MKYKKRKKCIKTRKTSFESENTAGQAMFRIWSHDTSADIYDLHTYLCDNCKSWHIGHKSYYAKAQAKQQSTSVPA